MAEPPPPSPPPPATHITDVDADAIADCTKFLRLQDLSNLAMSCKQLRHVSYSDSIWRRLFGERWPYQSPAFSSGFRENYLRRRSDILQFKFSDPFVFDYDTDAKRVDRILVKEKQIIFSQGPEIRMIKIDDWLNWRDLGVTLRGNCARFTSLRLVPVEDTFLYHSERQRNEDVLITSGTENCIRILWKGSCRRSLTGHKGAVTALSDKLLGNGAGKVLASGGEDGTVRLWSLCSGGRRDKHALKTTFYGHQKPIKMMSVAGHKTSILVTATGDSKVRLWDVAAQPASPSSSCVGMTSVPGTLVNMKCHEQLLYLAAGFSISIIDLREMRTVLSYFIDEKLYSFETVASKSLFCVGSDDGRAMLYDIRKVKLSNSKAEPVTELAGGHNGPITHLHMDPYKIVTGGRGKTDSHVNVWEPDTGALISSLNRELEGSTMDAMAVNGHQIVTANISNTEDAGIVHNRDFSNASCLKVNDEVDLSGKFWNPECYSDTE